MLSDALEQGNVSAESILQGIENNSQQVVELFNYTLGQEFDVNGLIQVLVKTQEVAGITGLNYLR